MAEITAQFSCLVNPDPRRKRNWYIAIWKLSNGNCIHDRLYISTSATRAEAIVYALNHEPSVRTYQRTR